LVLSNWQPFLISRKQSSFKGLNEFGALSSQCFVQSGVWPTPLPNTLYSYVGLVVDSTTTKICRQGGPFEEVQPYFDKKNAIYGIKKEVAVSAVTPHYALFSSPFHLGSEHEIGHYSTSFPLSSFYSLFPPSPITLSAS